MADTHHAVVYLKFRIQLTGRPVSAKVRLYNGDNPSGNSGQLRLITGAWTERGVTYDTRPELGKVVGEVGSVAEHQVIEVPLDLSLDGLEELHLAIDPTGCDGLTYIAREGGRPAELIVEYVE